jgi:hypothetical protein
LKVVPLGTTVVLDENIQKFVYGDFIVQGEVLLNDNSELVVLNGDLILSGGTISGTGQTVLVDLPTFGDLISSGSYSGGTLTLSKSNGSDINVSGFFTAFLRNETNSGSTDTIKINESIFNPSNLTVLSTSIFIVDTNADYYVLGDLYNYGEIIVEGVLKVGGTIYNYGVITGSGIIE